MSCELSHERRRSRLVRRFHWAFVLLNLPLGLIFLGISHFSAPMSAQAQKAAQAPLEIRLTKHPKWEKGCLSLGVDRVNGSSGPLFLLVNGLYISTSVTEVGNDAGKTDVRQWVNIYGMSDIVNWEASSLAPGATIHDDLCVGPDIAVVSLERKSRRKIPLRGKLRIDAYYFLTEMDWRKYKLQHEEMGRTPPKQWNKIERHDPQVITAFAPIPCLETGCPSGCDIPPFVLHGETSVMPDVSDSLPQYAERGKAISDDIARRRPACPSIDNSGR
jgi:hypothetical protein